MRRQLALPASGGPAGSAAGDALSVETVRAVVGTVGSAVATVQAEEAATAVAPPATAPEPGRTVPERIEVELDGAWVKAHDNPHGIEVKVGVVHSGSERVGATRQRLR